MSVQGKNQAGRLQQQGIEEAKNSNLSGAIELWQQALTIYQEISEQAGEGKALSNLALAHHFLGDYQQALTYHQQSLAIEADTKEEFSVTIKFDNYQYGEYTSSRQIGTPKSLGYLRFNLGFTYYWLNDYARAIEQYELSLAIVRELKDIHNEVIILAQLGEVYFYLGQYNQSIIYHEQAVNIAEQINELSSQGNSLNSIGNGYSKLGDWKKATQYYQIALPILETIGNYNGRGNALAGIGIALSNQNYHDRAIDYFQQSLKLFQQINNRYNSGRALNLLGQAHYFLGNYDRAIDYHQKSLAISQELQEIFSEEKARTDLGLCLYKSGQLKLAEENLRVSINIVESIRSKLGSNDEFKISIFDRQTEPYQLLQAVLIAQDQKEQALEISERSRARAFVELLAQRSELWESTSITIKSLSSNSIKQIAKKQKATLVEYSLIQTRGLESAKLYIWVVSSSRKVNFKSIDIEIRSSRSIS